eukprot:CAMPEP_0116014170 /NCGR_PEP_ID=MMETSP0321-20121206/6131_1 /TAXON_ID=163516 /ORGANISM="Leptocylindrus danicus var. danicus, Strain B650" /LENGTH=385 /DNA_ID=CAMNT_0003483797 /DNA_START=143 /DNA_END=1303 /DNA_ORIENTATION=-
MMPNKQYVAKKKSSSKSRSKSAHPPLVPSDLAGIASTTRSAAGSYFQQNKMRLQRRAKKWQDYIPRVKANKIKIRGDERKADVLAIAYLNFFYDKLDQRQEQEWNADKHEKENVSSPGTAANEGMDEGDTVQPKTLFNWKLRYEELMEFKNTHGHCLVPQRYKENPNLGKWVSNQRKRFKLRKKKELESSYSFTALSSERYTLLENIGFVWSVGDYSWRVRYEELKQFKREFGTCMVPKMDKKYPKLGSWVRKQRERYKALINGERLMKNGGAILSTEEFDLLQDIDFVWSVHEYIWKTRYEELMEYKNEHGNCLVPGKYSKNPSLGNWVDLQRARYKAMKKGEKTLKRGISAMTADQAKMLEKIGFEFYFPSSNNAASADDDEL